MKRKGFTIIEIIISLVILVSIGLVVGVSLNKVFKNTEEAEADSFKDQIITSADLYIANNQSKINELQTTKGYLLIPVGDLIEAGLLDGNAIDPETGEKVSHDNLVKVSLDANGLLKIEYNMDSPNEPYLEAQTLIIDYNENFNCQNIESYRDEWGTQTLRLIDTNGDVMSASIDDVISKIECDIDTSKPGSNQINYVYKTHVDAPLKSLSRTAVVSASPSDIITLSAVANPDTVTINNPITFTVTGTDRVGNQSVLNTSDYIIEAHSTNKVGTFSPVITYNKNNSDGSKPTTTVTYTVNYDPNDIVSLSATASPTKVIVNGNVTFKVTGTTRSGTKKTLTPSDYTIAQNSTTSAGVKKPTFTYNKTNSDGSKPTTTVTYTVIDSISAIIDLDPNCTNQSDGSCWYIGNQSGNYLTYLGKTWRIYKKDAAGALSIILNDTTGGTYAFTFHDDKYICSPSTCCNSADRLSSSTAQYLVSQNPNGLLTHLNSFLNGLSGTKSYIKSSQFDISQYNGTSATMTNNIGLLSYSDYSKIAGCSTFTCNASYLRISSNWGLGNYYTTNRSYSSSYDISTRNFNRNRTPKYHESLYVNTTGNVAIADGAWTLTTTAGRTVASSAGTRLSVKPVIVLNNNVKIIGGNGIVSNPYKVV